MSILRIGIIGAGDRGITSFGYVFTQQFHDQVKIVAVADPNKERAMAGLDFLGIQADVYEDYRDMLARNEIDAVVVATPDHLHEEQCLAALKRRKHVLVDKPLATTARGCLRVIEAAGKAGTLLYMGFNLRQDVVVRKLKELIMQETFGEIFSIQAIEHYHGGRTYMSRWNRLKKYSGGLFIHKGSHDFDVINWFMGKARPVRVSCFGNVSVFNKKHLPFKLRKGVKPGPTCSVCKYQEQCPDKYLPEKTFDGLGKSENVSYAKMWDENASKEDAYDKNLCMYLSDKDTHDQGIAIVEYDNGATASHSEYFATPISNRQYLIEGTLGHGEGDMRGNRIEFFPRWTQDQVDYNLCRDAGGHGGADPKMCAEFVECVRRKRRPTATGVDGAWSVAIGEACELARTERRVVKISEVLDVKSRLLKP